MTEINSLLQKCYYCPDMIQGDGKYHQVYIEGKLVGIRHRRCGPLGNK
jgi:hypothetical protein